MDAEDLKRKLMQLDGRGYKAYREVTGTWEFPRFTLLIDHVQGDPFAAPSRLRARVGQDAAAFPSGLFGSRVRRVALEDFIARAFDEAVAKFVRGHRGTGKSGLIGIDSGGQEVIERTAALVSDRFVEARFVAGLPAAGRRCLGREAAAMLLDELPRVVDASLYYDSLDAAKVREHVESVEDQEWLRERLPEMALVAFVGEGSVLPRESGISDRPLESDRVVRFVPPPQLRVLVELPNAGPVYGMGIPEGITLIVGGGYHGKSTLLWALQRCVYSHVPADGRELVVTRPDAMKIRAEDGRRVEKVDISPFISNLPFGVDTSRFRTENASGSTSQAANIIEALEAGSRLLLIDEDTSATNFMIRDELMQKLVPKEKEPITPFIDQALNLSGEHGVSTVLVMGGSGDYFEIAGTVIAMEDYVPRVVTQQARKIALARRDARLREAAQGFGPLRPRVPLAGGIDPKRGQRDKIVARGIGTLSFGKQTVDLAQVEQLVDISQTRAIGDMVAFALREGYFDGNATLKEVVDRIFTRVDDEGLDVLSGRPGTDYALPRPLEAAAMLNRLRTLTIK